MRNKQVDKERNHRGKVERQRNRETDKEDSQLFKNLLRGHNHAKMNLSKSVLDNFIFDSSNDYDFNNLDCVSVCSIRSHCLQIRSNLYIVNESVFSYSIDTSNQVYAGYPAGYRLSSQISNIRQKKYFGQGKNPKFPFFFIYFHIYG